MKILINKNVNWIVVIMLSFFISEAVYKLLLHIDITSIRISGIVKFIFQIFMFFAIIINYKKSLRSLLLLILLCIIFLVGQLALPNNLNIINNAEYLNNSLFIIIMLLFVNSIPIDNKQKKSAIKYFETIVILNSIAIVVGLIFSIDYFKTYYNPRFGYDGFLMKSSYASYLYLIGTFYFGQKLNKPRKKDILLFIFITFSAIITGTKAAMLSVILVIIYLIIANKLYFNKVILSIIFSVVLLTLVFHAQIIDLFMTHSKIFGPIIIENGFTTALFSYRDLILTESLIPYVESNWGILNYLFGGMGDIMIKSGLDFIDIIYFFGILGTGVYVYLLINQFFTFQKKLDNLYFIFMIILVSSLAGNFFYNSSLAVFICIIKLHFELKYGKKN